MELASAACSRGLSGWLRLALLALGLVLLAWPAFAGSIEHFTDKQGTIHIGNPGATAPASPGMAAPPSQAPTPEQLPPPAPHLASPPAPEEVPATPQGEARMPAEEGAPDFRREPEQQPQQAAPAAPPVPPPSQEGNLNQESQPVPQAAGPGEILTQPAPVQAAAAATQPAPAQTTPPGELSSPRLAACVVNRFRDHAGVIHITNNAAQEDGGVQVAEARPEPAIPFKKTAFEASLPEAAAPGLAVACSPVSRYQDRHGVIHITNAPASQAPDVMMAAAPAPAPRPAWTKASLAQVEKVASSRPPEPQVARRQHAQKRAPIEPRESPPALWVFPQPDSFISLVRAPVQGGAAGRPPPPAEAPGPANLLTEGSIRSYRDKKGVIHIANLPPPPSGAQLAMAPPAPSPENLAAAPAGQPAGPTPEAIRPPPAPAGAPLAGLAPGPPGPAAVPTVTAHRDRQGKLVITNLLPARPPTWDGRAVAALEPFIAEAARWYGLPPPLIRAIIKVESNFVPQAVSPKGAMGLMQLMPGTAALLGVQDPFSPRENILGGCRYFRFLLNYFNGSLPLALAGYNAGHQRVVAAGFRIPAIRETQDFVTRVLEHYYLATLGNPRPWI